MTTALTTVITAPATVTAGFASLTDRQWFCEGDANHIAGVAVTTAPTPWKGDGLAKGDFNNDTAAALQPDGLFYNYH